MGVGTKGSPTILNKMLLKLRHKDLKISSLFHFRINVS